MARVDGLPKSSGGQDSHEEDVGEEGHVSEHQDGVEAGLRDEISKVFKNINIFRNQPILTLQFPPRL